jgi:serine/threonine protein kinase
MVYEMLTGQLPFQADTAWQWATHHMTSPPRSFDDTPGGGRIPEALRRTVLKALSKEPADRQSSAGQFYTEFVANAGNTTSVAPKAPVNAMGRTEAMPQATPFVMAPTEGMPVSPGISPPAPAIASPPVALPPAPAREQPSGNKGLIYGLSGVGAVLLIAMGVVALSSNRGGGEPASPIVTTPTTTGAPSAESPAETPPAIEPEPTPDEPEPTPSASPEPTERPKPAATTKPASSKPAPAQPAPKPATPSTSSPSTSSPSTPSPSTTPAPAAPATPAPAPPAQQTAPPIAQPTPPATQPAPQQPAPAADPCVACMQAASRDILAASQAYAQCKNPALQSKCTGRAVPTAAKTAENAAFNQKCSEAKAIIAAALAMGVPASRLAKAQSAAQSCK